MDIPLKLKFDYFPTEQAVTATVTLGLKQGPVAFEVRAKNLNPYGVNEEEELVIKQGNTEILRLNKDSELSSELSREDLSKLPTQTQAGLLLFSVIGEPLYGFYVGIRKQFESGDVWGSIGERMRETHRWFGAEGRISERTERTGMLKVKPEQQAWFDSFPATPTPSTAVAQ